MSHIARSSLIIAVFFGLEKALGMLRNILVAQTFGLSSDLDAYNVANNLPDLIFALIIGGALAIALIPVLSETLEREGRPALWDLFAHIANLVFLITALLSVVVALFAEPLVQRVIAPGFEVEQQLLVADLMRLNLIATLFFSLGGLIISGLQANQHFLLPALAPSMYDLGAFFGIIFLVPERGYQVGPITLPAFGLGIRGLVYGTILGATLFFLIQLPGLAIYRFRWRPAIKLRHPGVTRVLALLGPRILMVLLIQVIFVAQDNLASFLSTGTVTALVYGWLIMQFPETVIGTTIGTAFLPTLSEQAARGGH
ncbi:MAG TPA: lipid II flippase MurJ, partial [Anaerolineales bacterium]|nr:lipid II flippase MurJ [Anaerolineales bacterium]